MRSSDGEGRSIRSDALYPALSGEWEVLKRNPHAGDLYVFRGRSGSLIKILWHDGIGMSL
jgi:hypothetical protein